MAVHRFALSALLACTAALPAPAQEAGPETIPFAGGSFTIAENDDLEKVLAFDGREIARDYVLYYDRTVDLNGTEAALFEIGPGGNACGAATLIAWKPEGGEMQTAQAGDDCGSPPPAITGGIMYFVPYLLPGESAPVQMWTPEGGLRLAGILGFSPQPGTGWADIDPARIGDMIDIFANEAVYEASKARLGGDLTHVATGLTLSDGVHTLPSGVLYASGCVPHACGISDAFMAVDREGEALYFAQQDGDGGLRSWPDAGEWPADIRSAMTGALAQ